MRYFPSHQIDFLINHHSLVAHQPTNSYQTIQRTPSRQTNPKQKQPQAVDPSSLEEDEDENEPQSIGFLASAVSTVAPPSSTDRSV